MANASLDHTHVARAPAPRVALALLCDVRQGTRPWARVRLEDISQNGFRIPWLLNCAADFPLRIRIPGLQVLSARVCWQKGRALGCEFSVPLHSAVFEHIVREAAIEAEFAR
jgi:PilZ domain